MSLADVAAIATCVPTFEDITYITALHAGLLKRSVSLPKLLHSLSRYQSVHIHLSKILWRLDSEKTAAPYKDLYSSERPDVKYPLPSVSQKLHYLSDCKLSTLFCLWTAATQHDSPNSWMQMTNTYQMSWEWHGLHQLQRRNCNMLEQGLWR